jgi:hypothetical protein
MPNLSPLSLASNGREFLPTEVSMDGWGPLPDLSAPSAPAFPFAGLPPVLAEPIREIARFVQVEKEAVGAVALGVVSAAIRGAFEVQVTGDYREPVNLYLLVAMESGARKSELVKRLAKPLYDYERRLMEEARVARHNKLAERKRLERDLRRAERGGDAVEIEDEGRAAVGAAPTARARYWGLRPAIDGAARGAPDIVAGRCGGALGTLANVERLPGTGHPLCGDPPGGPGQGG